MSGDEDIPVTAISIFGVKRFDVGAAFHRAFLDAELRRWDAKLLAYGQPVVRRSIIPQTRTGNVVQFPR